MVLQREWRQIVNQVCQLIARAWLDEKFKAQFIANPQQILEEAGIDVPEGVDVRIDESANIWSVQESEDGSGAVWTIPLPPKLADVTDEQLTDLIQGRISSDQVRATTLC
ncbi:hypothetical protein [Kamptonema formosum]|uniref:hypothetical protein n=1 Tax=Kamptonema formosum TaxID=331992 RepID=UPI000344B827|nr:hypothetical protein [Oscillatoria sp. PCC 10802]